MQLLRRLIPWLSTLPALAAAYLATRIAAGGNPTTGAAWAISVFSITYATVYAAAMFTFHRSAEPSHG